MTRFGLLKTGSLFLIAIPQALWLLQPIPLGAKLGSLAFIALAAWRPALACLVMAVLGPIAQSVLSAFQIQMLGARLVEQLALALITGVLIRRRPRPAFSATSFGFVIVGLIAVASAASVVPARMIQAEGSWSDVWTLGHAWIVEYFGPRVPAGAVVFALLTMEGLALAWAIATLIRADRTLARRLAWFLVAGHAMAAVVNLQQIVTMAQSASESAGAFIELLKRARTSSQYDRNAAGSAFAAVWLAGLVLLSEPWRRRVGALLLLAIIAVGGVWLTGSRSGQLSLVIVGACVLATRLSGQGRIPLRVIGAVSACVVVLIALYAALAPSGVHATLRESLLGRQFMAGVALRMFRASPVFGAGIGMFFEQSPMFGALSPENAHNNFLQILAEQGLVGFTALMALLLVVLAPALLRAIVTRDQTLIAFLAGTFGFVLTWLTGHPLLEPDSAFVFWILLGATIGLTPERPAPARAARWLGVIAAALVIAHPFRAAQMSGTIDLNDLGINLSAPRKDEQGRWYRQCLGQCAVYAQGNSFAVVPLRKPASATAPVRVDVRSKGRLVQTVELTGNEWRDVPVLIAARSRRYEAIALTPVSTAGGPAVVEVGQVQSHSAAGDQTRDATPEAIARRCIADAWEQQTDAALALEHCQLAVRQFPESPELHEALGRMLFYRLSRQEEGLAAYREAVTLRARTAPVFRQELDWSAIAHTLEMSGALDEAVGVLDAHDVRGDLADAIRAHQAQAAGRFKDAIALYWHAIAQNDRDPWYFNGLAIASLANGDRVAARQAWERALKIDPTFEPALTGLKSLR